jgi:hypothetical protein
MIGDCIPLWDLIRIILLRVEVVNLLSVIYAVRAIVGYIYHNKMELYLSSEEEGPMSQ